MEVVGEVVWKSGGGGVGDLQSLISNLNGGEDEAFEIRVGLEGVVIVGPSDEELEIFVPEAVVVSKVVFERCEGVRVSED